MEKEKEKIIEELEKTKTYAQRISAKIGEKEAMKIVGFAEGAIMMLKWHEGEKIVRPDKYLGVYCEIREYRSRAIINEIERQKWLDKEVDAMERYNKLFNEAREEI